MVWVSQEVGAKTGSKGQEVWRECLGGPLIWEAGRGGSPSILPHSKLQWPEELSQPGPEQPVPFSPPDQ
jgi:hypothetical protein